MLSQRVGVDFCRLAQDWKLDLGLASALIRLDTWAGDESARAGLVWPGLWIISGNRSPASQFDLNPESPGSLHTRCPSLAADLRIGNVPASISTEVQWTWLGARWKWIGGRWGGDFDPPDLNHFDLGIGV